MREDGELGLRLSELGVERRFVANAVAYQTCKKSAKELAKQAECFAEADLLISRKHPGKVKYGFLRRIESEPKWKRSVREFLAMHPALADSLLAPLCGLGGLLREVPPFRTLRLRALHTRCGLHWYGRLLQLTNGAPRLH
jgi:hypothetical protein